MERGIMFMEDGLCVPDFVREEMIKPGGGLLKNVHNLVVTLGHGGGRPNNKAERPNGFAAIGVLSSPDRP